MNLVEIEKIVAKIQNNIFKNSNSVSIGMLKSHFKGSGLQFKEHQVYMTGDDVRFIDWKLSAKTNNTFVKTFEEERNVEIVAIVDITNSMFTGFKDISKLKASVELVCLLYMLTEKSNDTVSTIIIHNDITILPPFSGRKGITAFVSSLTKLGLINAVGEIILHAQTSYQYDEKKKLALIQSYVARKKEVVYLGDLSSFEQELPLFKRLTTHPNMHCFKIVGPIDKTNKLPFSLFGINDEKNKTFFRVFKQRKELEEKGRWQEIGVEERYLEEFIRKML